MGCVAIARCWREIEEESKRRRREAVQEANISYPAEAQLLRKLAQKCAKVVAFVKHTTKRYAPPDLQIDLAAIIAACIRLRLPVGWVP